MARAALLTAAQLTTYDYAMDYLKSRARMHDNITIHYAYVRGDIACF